MDTYRIYEQFKEPFGEPAARALAETLGRMFEELHDTVTKEDFSTLREAIGSDVSRLDRSLERLAEAQTRTEANVAELADGQRQLAEAQTRTEANVARLDATVAKLAEAQTRTEANVARLDATVAKLAEAQTRTEANVARLDATVAKLAEAQARTEVKVAELAAGQRQLAEAQARSEANIAHLDATVAKLAEAQTAMATALERLTIRTDDVVGRTFELHFRDRLTAYLGRFLRRGKLVPNDRLLDQIEPHLSDREVDDVLRADVIASGLVNGEQTHVVVEVSFTGDVDDIVRADERARLLRRAGLAAIPLVACNAISPESTAFAKGRQVRIWLNGSLLESAA
jgi:cyanate lyase